MYLQRKSPFPILNAEDAEADGFNLLMPALPFFGLPEGGPILFLLSPEVSETSGTMSIYLYIYIIYSGTSIIRTSVNRNVDYPNSQDIAQFAESAKMATT